MALEDYLEPEVGIAVAVTAAVASPKVRGTLRKGAVYGLAGLLKAGDAVSALAKGVRRGAQEAMVPDADGAAPATAVVTENPAETPAAVTEPVETPHKRPRKTSEAANGE